MAKQFIEIENASNEEAAQMFSAICKKVIKQDEGDMKEMLGIPKSTSPTTKDLISLIQESKVDCKIVVFYDDATEYKQAIKSEKENSSGTELSGKTGDDLPF